METVVRLLSSIAANLAFPLVLLRALVNRRWRQTLRERCGGGMWHEVAASDRQIIWFHGASIGEITGLVPVIAEVRKRHPEFQVLVTTTSFSGKEEVRRRRLADRSLIFPVDHPLVVAKTLKQIRPRVVILAETELWPNFLFAAKDLDIPVVLVNARMSEYSYPRYRRLRALFRPLLRSLKLILVQTKVDYDRFLAVGAAETQLEVSGSTKYSQIGEALSGEERAAFAQQLGINLAGPVFVAGSVRSGEDEHVIRAFSAVKRDIPTLQMIIAPRHPERFERVARLLYTYGIKYSRRSENGSMGNHDVIMLDTIGELQRAYALGSFAFVGGSLVDIGGHNPLEPAACRTPVIIGPHRSNVQDMADDLEAKGGLFVVKNEDELTYTMSRLARNPDECLARGARAYEVWKRNSGALDRVLPRLEEFLVEAAEPEPAAAVG